MNVQLMYHQLRFDEVFEAMATFLQVRLVELFVRLDVIERREVDGCVAEGTSKTFLFMTATSL